MTVTHLFFLALTFCVVRSDNVAYVVSDADGTDDSQCLANPQEHPCKTIQYLLASQFENVDVTVADGTYIFPQTMEVQNSAAVQLLGSENRPTIQNSDASLCWKFTNPNGLTVVNFTFLLTDSAAIQITDGTNISLESLILTWGESITTWCNAITITGSKPVVISSITVQSVNVPSDVLAIPYVFDLNDCSDVAMTGVTDASPALGLLSLVKSTTAAVTNLTLTALVSNKLYFDQADNVTITTVTTATAQSSFDSTLTNSEMIALARHISSMSAIDVELQRRTRLSNTLGETNPAAVVHLIYITGATTATLKELTVSNLHTASVYVGSTSAVTIQDSDFSQNVHAFSSNCFRSVYPSPSLNRGSLATQSGYNVLGEGVTLTLKSITKSVVVQNTTFKGNSITYSSDSLTEMEHSYLQLHTSAPSRAYRRRAASATSQTAKIVQVVADVFIDKLDDAATVTISNVNFEDEHMSYDETLLSDSEKDKHFIVSEFSDIAPTEANMRHVLSSRSSCCVFVAEGGSDISVTASNFTTVQGSAVVMVGVNKVSLSDLIVTDLTTQANVFSESAFYFGNIPNTTSNAASSLTIQNVNVTNVQPSPLSAKYLNIDRRGDNGFSINPVSYNIDKQRYLLPELGGGAISVDWFDQVNVSASTLQTISSAGNGGAFDFRYVGSICIANTNFSDTQSLYGAGGCVSLTDQVLKSISIESVIVAHCTAQSHGGAFYIPIVTPDHELTLTVSSLAIHNCQAAEGGGLFIGSLSEADRATNPSKEAQMTLTDVNVTECSSLYGAGMYLGSVQHVCYVTMNNIDVSSCTSSLSGAAVYFSASLYIPDYYGPTTVQESRYGLHLASCTFSSNIAGAFAGGIFTNVYTVPHAADTQKSSEFTALSSLENEEAVPAILAENCNFTENQCAGSQNKQSLYGTHGGAAFAQYVHTASQSVTTPTNANVLYNTLIRNCTFQRNDGGAYAPLQNVVAYISNSVFDTNFATFFENDTKFLLNIECEQSKLNLALDNTFTNNNITTAISYLCDSTCADFSETYSGKKCASPKSIPPKEGSSGQNDLNPDDYPVIPQLKYTIGAVHVGQAKVVISTSASLPLNDGSDSFLDQVLLQNKVRASAGFPPLAIYASVNKQFGNTTFSVADPVYRPLRLRRAKRYTEDSLLVPNAAAPVHVQAATATPTGNIIDDPSLTSPLTEVDVVTEGDNFKLSTADFPSDAPDQLYAYVSADGVYWTEPITLAYVHPLSQEDKNKWGYITLAVMFGMILLFLLIVLVLQLCIWGLQKRYSSESYGHYEPI